MISKQGRKDLTGALITTIDGRKGIVEMITKDDRIFVENENEPRFIISLDEIDDVLATAESIERDKWEMNQLENADESRWER